MRFFSNCPEAPICGLHHSGFQPFNYNNSLMHGQGLMLVLYLWALPATYTCTSICTYTILLLTWVLYALCKSHSCIPCVNVTRVINGHNPFCFLYSTCRTNWNLLHLLWNRRHKSFMPRMILVLFLT